MEAGQPSKELTNYPSGGGEVAMATPESQPEPAPEPESAPEAEDRLG